MAVAGTGAVGFNPLHGTFMWKPEWYGFHVAHSVERRRRVH